MCSEEDPIAGVIEIVFDEAEFASARPLLSAETTVRIHESYADAHQEVFDLVANVQFDTKVAPAPVVIGFATRSSFSIV